MLYQLSYVREEPEDTAAALAGAGGRPPPTTPRQGSPAGAPRIGKSTNPARSGGRRNGARDRPTLAHCRSSFYPGKGCGVRVEP